MVHKKTKQVEKSISTLKQNILVAAITEAFDMTPSLTLANSVASQQKQYNCKDTKEKWVINPSRVFSELSKIVMTYDQDLEIPRGILVSTDGNFDVPVYRNQMLTYTKTFNSFFAAVEFLNDWQKSKVDYNKSQC